MQDGKTDDFVPLITYNHIVIGHLTTGRMAGLSIVHIQRVDLGVVCQLDRVLRRPIHRWNELQTLLNICYGHNCRLFSKD